MFEITDEQGIFLVKLAREAVEENLKDGRTISPPEDTPSNLMDLCGVFVTLNKIAGERKQLRGCIGLPHPTHPLVRATIEAAVESATRDPRFHRVTTEELEDIVFEVSVLTPPELIEVDSPRDLPSMIKIGEDGLIVERGYYRGLLLPQVPIEWNWDEQDFLCQCCLKAGLAPDSWLLGGTKIYRFQAIIFQEISPRGPVNREKLLSDD
jgi:uncharacterized protein (TIGR00296 family)